MGDHFSSYVLTIMIPTYRACARENGPGMMARMHQIMATHMDRRDIFWHIYRRIDSECRNAFTAMDAALRASSANVCEELQRAFETANSGSVTTDGPGTRAEDVAAVRELVEAVQRKLDRVGYWEVTQPQDPDAGRPSAQCCQQALKT